MDVVTDEGRLVRASEDENPDLFWGLRGGGGNFGVVTSIDYTLHPVGPEIVGGLVAWPASAAPDVLDFYRTFAAQAPPELTLVALMRPAPPAPWLPNDAHGKPIVALLACYSGDPAKGEKLLAPLKSLGRPIGDVLVRRPYTQLQSLLDATQPKGRRYYWKSEYLPRIEPALCEKVIQHAAAITSPHSAVVLFQLEGALNRLDSGSLGGREPRRALRVQRDRGVGPRGRRCGPGRVGAPRLERPEGVLDGRHLPQLPDRGGRPRTDGRGARHGDSTGSRRSKGSGTRTTCSGPTGT